MPTLPEILEKPVAELKTMVPDIPDNLLAELLKEETNDKNRLVALQVISSEIKRRQVRKEESSASPGIKKPRRYSLVISSTDKDSSPVHLSVNGKNISILRDKKVEVSAEYIECLKHSTVNTITRNPANGDIVPVTRPRYMYQAEEID